MTSSILNSMSNLALAPSANSRRESATADGSWFEAIARAWGNTLDNQAQRITEMSDQIGQGDEMPSQIAKLTAESMRMSFMANSSQTSMDSIGRALETMARKQ
jgi:hypothetical protein